MLMSFNVYIKDRLSYSIITKSGPPLSTSLEPELGNRPADNPQGDFLFNNLFSMNITLRTNNKP